MSTTPRLSDRASAAPSGLEPGQDAGSAAQARPGVRAGARRLRVRVERPCGVDLRRVEVADEGRQLGRLRRRRESLVRHVREEDEARAPARLGDAPQRELDLLGRRRLGARREVEDDHAGRAGREERALADTHVARRKRGRGGDDPDPGEQQHAHDRRPPRERREGGRVRERECEARHRASSTRVRSRNSIESGSGCGRDHARRRASSPSSSGPSSRATRSSARRLRSSPWPPARRSSSSARLERRHPVETARPVDDPRAVGGAADEHRGVGEERKRQRHEHRRRRPGRDCPRDGRLADHVGARSRARERGGRHARRRGGWPPQGLGLRPRGDAHRRERVRRWARSSGTAARGR